jgi:hypothetical protein
MIDIPKSMIDLVFVDHDEANMKPTTELDLPDVLLQARTFLC